MLLKCPTDSKVLRLFLSSIHFDLHSLLTAYVRGKVMFDTCLSIHPSVCLSTPGGGGTPARSSWGGTPARSSGGVLLLGVPQWMYPTLGTPLSVLARGIPWQGGTPLWVLTLDLAGVIPRLGGYPTSVTPHQTWLGGGTDGGYSTSGSTCSRYASCVHVGGLSCFYLCWAVHLEQGFYWNKVLMPRMSSVSRQWTFLILRYWKIHLQEGLLCIKTWWWHVCPIVQPWWKRIAVSSVTSQVVT